MRVKELIAELEKLDPELPILLFDRDYGSCHILQLRVTKLESWETPAGIRRGDDIVVID